MTQKDARGNQVTPYWAASTADECVNTALTKIDDYYRWLDMCGRRNIMRRSWMFYNTAAIHGTGYVTAGDFNEYMMFKVNEYRTILQTMIALVISQRPA